MQMSKHKRNQRAKCLQISKKNYESDIKHISSDTMQKRKGEKQRLLERRMKRKTRRSSDGNGNPQRALENPATSEENSGGKIISKNRSKSKKWKLKGRAIFIATS